MCFIVFFFKDITDNLKLLFLFKLQRLLWRFNMENSGSDDVKREREVMPMSAFIVVLGIIRDLFQNVDYLSEKSDNELCEIRNKNPRNNIIYFIQDKTFQGHSIAHGILRSRYPSLVEFDNETLKEAVKLYKQDTKQAEEQYGPIAFWDVSQVTDMMWIFHRCREFNGDLSRWDVSQVTNMRFMFYNCDEFNCDLSEWDVSQVTNMDGMFDGCGRFNSDISQWDVSQVTSMGCMFYNCYKFKSDLSKWDVSQVTNMDGMFYKCNRFNCDISQWDVSQVTSMGCMFDGCYRFNCDLSQWDVSQVTTMVCMFNNCYRFKRDLSKWVVSKVTTDGMDFMFEGCLSMDKLPEWYK